VAKVEVDDNYAVVAKELEEGDPFYIVLCNQLVYQYPATFTNGWNNTFLVREMVLGGHWYKWMPSHKGKNPSYTLLIDSPPTITYFQLVVQSKVIMLLSKNKKSLPKFSMSLKVWEGFVFTMEEMKAHEQI